MADMSREEVLRAMSSFRDILWLSEAEKGYFDFAISDMKRVAELEKTEEKCNAILSNLSENIDATMKDFFAKFEELEAENKRLTDLLYEQSKNLDSLNLEVERLKDGKEKLRSRLQANHELYKFHFTAVDAGRDAAYVDTLNCIKEYFGE